MDLASIRQLKQDVITEVIAKNFNAVEGEISTQSLLSAPPENRIAIGYSKLKDDTYRLELRVQKEDRLGHEMAKNAAKMAEAQGVKANTEIIPTISVPTRKAIQDSSKKTPTIDESLPERKLELGLEITHKDGNAGTLGAFIEKVDGIYILSCSHVIALSGDVDTNRSATSTNNFIYHPGKSGKGSVIGAQRIALLTDFTEPSKDINEIDAAIARILPNCRPDFNQIPIGRGYENEGTIIRLIEDFDSLSRDREIAKIGRSTGFSVGLLRAVEMDFVPVQITFPQSKRGVYRFDNLIEIRWKSVKEPFSSPGDSGSLAFTRDTHEAFGLVFAGGQREDGEWVSYCCDLRPILSNFRAKLYVR